MNDVKTIANQLGGAVHQNEPMSRTGLEERIFSFLFRGLVYAQIWEDPVVDMEALRIGPETKLVCIASGSCNMMSYLTAGPASVNAVDLSPAHVALGRLKIAAARTLTQPEFYDMFGRADRRRNRDVFERKLAPVLDRQTLAWWTARANLFGRRIDMLTDGFYRHGVLGRFITAGHIASWLGGVNYTPLLEARSLAEQEAFFEAQIAPLFEKRIVKWITRHKASLFGLGIPPQQYDKLAADANGDVLEVLRARMRKLICDFPISENYFAWAAFNRGYKQDGTGPVPPYLEAERFEALKAHAARASIVNRSLTDMLTDLPTGSRQAYVLLDAQDWMTDAQLNALWAQITRTATPGARVVFRTGGSDNILPGRVSNDILLRWNVHDDEARALWARDRSAIYGGFHIYEFGG